MFNLKPFHLLFAIFIGLMLSACGDSSSSGEDLINDLFPVSSQFEDDDATDEITSPQSIEPTGFISGVSIDDVAGRFFAGSAPQPTGNVSATPDSDEAVTIISGGSTSVELDSVLGFFRVYVTSDNEGYFLVELPEVITEAALVISYSTIQLDGDVSLIQIQSESANGSVSDTLDIPVTTLSVGTGEVQVSVSWDQPVDLDLAVFEPDGNEIYFASPTSESGGMLDLDSNAGCGIDGINNENITYDGVTPPPGDYRVALNLWSDCGVTEPVNYVVTVRANGRLQTFRGVITEDDFDLSITSFTVEGN